MAKLINPANRLADADSPGFIASPAKDDAIRITPADAAS